MGKKKGARTTFAQSTYAFLRSTLVILYNYDRVYFDHLPIDTRSQF